MVSEYGRAPRHGLELPRGLALYTRLVLALTAIPLLVLLYLHLRGIPLYYGRQWSPPDDTFGDFWHYYHLLQFLHQPQFFASKDRFAYPAPCAVIYQVLYHLGSHPHVSFNLMLWTVQALSGLALLRAFLRGGLQRSHAWGLAALISITSYPWHVLYDRGNIELFVYVFIGLGVWAWLKDRDMTAAILWGCAGALKIYPLLLLAIFLQRGRWRALVVSLLTTACVLLLAFWYVGPTIPTAARGTLAGLTGFAGNYAANARRQELYLDHSALGALKELLSVHIMHLGNDWHRLSFGYEIAVVLLAPPLFLIWGRRMPALNQLCFLLIALMLLPPVSYDYTLIYAYFVIGIVFYAYLSAVRQGRDFPGRTAYVIAFTVLSTSQTYLRYQSLDFSGLLKCGALIATAVLLLRFPLRIEESPHLDRTI